MASISPLNFVEEMSSMSMSQPGPSQATVSFRHVHVFTGRAVINTETEGAMKDFVGDYLDSKGVVAMKEQYKEDIVSFLLENKDTKVQVMENCYKKDGPKGIARLFGRVVQQQFGVLVLAQEIKAQGAELKQVKALLQPAPTASE